MAPVKASGPGAKESGFGLSHDILVRLAFSAVDSFFHEVKVVGGENIPREGAVILASSHLNMAVDPACLSYGVHKAVKGTLRRYIHYWVKDSLFKNPVVGWLLLNAGNIPVDRKTKNNQILFRGTFEAMVRGEIIGVFPEGTSHHNSRMMPIKDGVSWTALEYLPYLEEHHGGANVLGRSPKGKKPAVVIPVGITYSDKTKYRSRAVVEFGKPITMDDYAEEFLSQKEGAAKSAVKRLTHKIEEEMHKLTINAEDWDTLNAAIMARDLLWEEQDHLRMESFVEVTQTLVDLFTQPDPATPLYSLKNTLIAYSSYLSTARIPSSSLSHIPLPLSSLDSDRPTRLPSRTTILALFLREFLSSLIRLPFFALPFLMHIPIYIIGRTGAKLVEDETETQAQMKMFAGLFVSILVYPIMGLGLFFAVFRMGGLLGSLAGLFLAGLCVWGLVMYHLSLIDDNYEHFRKLSAAFRILLGIWSPRSWDVTLPPPAPLSRASSYAVLTSAAALPSNPTTPPPRTGSPLSEATVASQPPPFEANKPRIPSRRLIRQILRTRLRAAKALEAYLIDLEEAPAGTKKVKACSWLATFFTDAAPSLSLQANGGSGGETLAVPSTAAPGEEPKQQGWRDGREVVVYLRECGAKIVPGAAGGAGAHWLEALLDQEKKTE